MSGVWKRKVQDLWVEQGSIHPDELGPSIESGEIAPESPDDGDLWIDTGSGIIPVTTLLGGLSNVDTETVSDNDVLAYNAGSSKWEPSGAYALASDLSVIDANVQTASYTLALSDAGKSVEMNVASANDLTVPPNSSVAFPVGTVVKVCQVGAGQTTIVAGSGVDIRTPETLTLTGQWSTVSLRKRATDEWVLAGDVEAA